MLQRIFLSFFLLTLLAASFSSSQAQGYTVTDLGSLGGNSFGNAINNQGQVAGHSYLADGTTRHAFLWDSVLGLQDLGAPSGFSSIAWSINDYSHIVGGLYSTGADHAFYWSSALGIVDLGSAGYAYCAADSINDADTFVGWFTNGTGAETDRRGWRHTGPSAINATDSLGTLANGGGSTATSINEADAVTGYALDASGNWHPIVWDSSGALSDLGSLGGSGGYPEATKMNSAGNVVGSGVIPSGTADAFLYSQSTLNDLGTLPGLPYASAMDINDANEIVGLASTVYAFGIVPGATIHGFIWSNGQMQDLNHLIPSASGWLFEEAHAINAGGQIAGTGYNGTQHHALRLDPIVPQTLTLRPSTTVGGKTAQATVTLSAPAVVDAVVYLTSQNAAAIVPATVIVHAGSATASFPIKTSAVASSVTGQITAYDRVMVSAPITVRPIGVKSVGLSPTTVVGGNAVSGAVTLEAPAAPGNITVNLSSTDPAVANPAVSSIIIPAGSLTGTFTVNTSAVSASTTVTIKASADGITKGKSLKVTP